MDNPPLLKPVDEAYLNQAAADGILTRARTLLYSGSLAEVVANREIVGTLVEEAVRLVGYGGIPDDVWDMLGMLDELVGGKVDRIALFVEKTAPAHLAEIARVYEEQKTRISLAQSRLKALLKDAVDLSGKPISGLFWSARVQDNSTPSVVVTDATKVPVRFKLRRFSLSFDFPLSAKIEKEVQTLLLKWGGEKAMVSGVTNFKGSVSELIPSKPIAEAFKAEEARIEKEGAKAAPLFQVPGTMASRENHLRIGPSKIKAGEFRATPLVLPKKDPQPQTEGESSHGSSS